MWKTLAAASAILVVAGPAFADCAADIDKIYEMLETAEVEQAKEASINELLDKAESAQKDGDEQACVEAVAEVSALLK